MRRFTFLLAAGWTIALAGCAGSTGWVNPSVPQDRWGADLSACRRDAEDEFGPGAYLPPGQERTSSPMTLVDRTRTTERFDSLVAECMQAKGYRRVG
jgi:hypothetical protein